VSGRLELLLTIAGKQMLTPDICGFDLRPDRGEALPPFAPGAHVNVEAPNGAVRSYSLTNGPADVARYVVAVARARTGRGGSASLVDQTAVGDRLAVSHPINSFVLEPADRYLLIAGGIGITPIRAMFRHLRARGGAVRLMYLTRSPAHTAYLDELSHAPEVTLHHSTRGRLDLWPVFAEPADDLHVYCCGPDGLMAEVRALTMHWRPSQLHFEAFSGITAVDGTSQAFRVVWQPTGESIEVAAGESLLAALRRRGLHPSSSCESGTCGSCRLRLIGGDPEHRDLCLSDHERRRLVMPCVSRARGGVLEIGPLVEETENGVR